MITRRGLGEHMSIGIRGTIAALSTIARGELSRYGPQHTSQVRQLENDLCAHFGVSYALGLNSGTSALICALVGAGVGPGDEVLVPSYTWVSTAAAPVAVGARPVLVDINESLTIDLGDAESKVSSRTRAIIPVHMINLPCDMTAVSAFAERHDLLVVEDACQAIGNRHHGKQLGTLGDAGAFSFNQHKNIYCGEGGALVTNSAEIYERALIFHDVGSYQRDSWNLVDESIFVGMNLRMPELAAAILRPQLRGLERQMKKRRHRRAYALQLFQMTLGVPFRESTHHDSESASGLALIFDQERHAKEFASRRGASRLLDSGRHVFTNWKSIQAQRTHHQVLDDLVWPNDPSAGKTECPNTTDILARSCTVHMAPELPQPAFRRIIDQLALPLTA